MWYLEFSPRCCQKQKKEDNKLLVVINRQYDIFKKRAKAVVKKVLKCEWKIHILLDSLDS